MVTVVLSALMVLLTPMGVLAEKAREAVIAQELANTKVPIESMNTETETYYRNGDGTMTYETHRDPIRVQDENGAWQEVDTAIVSTEEDTAILSEYADPAYEYQTKTSKYWTLLKEDITAEAPIKLVGENAVITVKPVLPVQEPTLQLEEEGLPPLSESGTSHEGEALEGNALGEVQMRGNQEASFQSAGMDQEAVAREEGSDVPNQVEREMALIPKAAEEDVADEPAAQAAAEEAPVAEYQSVEYRDVFEEGIHLRITPRVNGYKEEVILSRVPQSNRFSFEMQLEGNQYLDDSHEGYIAIYDPDVEKDGGLIGFIPAPFMEDSRIVEDDILTSYDIQVELEDLGNGKYRYTMIPSWEYLNDPEREYPVVIDPTVTMNTSGQIYDADIISAYKTTPYPSYSRIRVGKDTSNRTYRSFIWFKLPDHLLGMEGNVLHSATLSLYNEGGATQVPTEVAEVSSGINTMWDITWDNQPPDVLMYYPVDTTTVVGAGWYSWDITSIARKGQFGWTHKIVRLKSATENYQRVKSLYSLENGSATYNPKITVNYTPVSATTSVSAGPVNSSTGNISLSWTGIAGATYQVALEHGGQRTYYDAGTATSKTITGVPHNTTRGFVRYYMGDTIIGDTDWLYFTMPDTVSPQFPGGNATAAISGDTVNLTFPLASDNVGVDHYEIVWYNGAISQITTDSSGKVTGIVGNAQFLENHPSTELVLPISYDYEEIGMPSGGTVYFGIRAYDIKGNYTDISCLSNGVPIPEYLTPNAPSSLTVMNSQGESYGMEDSITFAVKDEIKIFWEILPATGSDYGIGAVQYKVGDGDWVTVSSDDMLLTGPDDTVAANGTIIALPEEGINVIQIRGVDSNPVNALTGPPSTINVNRDSQAPAVVMTYPDGVGEPPVWEIGDSIEITSVTDQNFEQITVELGVKLPFIGTAYNTVFTGTSDTIYPASIPLSSLALGNYEYALRVKANDSAGNEYIEEKSFYLAASANYVNPQLYIIGAEEDPLGTIVLNDVTRTIGYEAIESYILPDTYQLTLYADGAPLPNILVDKEARTITFNVVEPGNRELLLKEKPVSLHLELTAGDVTAYSVPIFTANQTVGFTEQEFSNLIGFTLGEGKLHVPNNLSTEGSFTLSPVESGLGLLNSVTVNTLGGLPSDVEVVFDVRFYDGEGYSTPVTVGIGEAASLAGTYYGYEITGRVTSYGTHTLDESLAITELTVTTRYTGINKRTDKQLVPSPTGLSAAPLVNYTTWLRWDEAEEDTDVLTYDVYRIPVSDEDPETPQRIAEDLREPYHYDYNLYYGQTFDYYVIAKKEFQTADGTYTAVSIPSIFERATIVDQGETDKYLGLQNYWSYVTMDVGSGDAYANVASGNLVYQKTDFANTAPLLASVMRRTYNSQSTSWTPLGVGWDFSFNTNLLSEYGPDAGGNMIEVAVLLKDGDGTIHRYEKLEDGSYKTPSGIFLDLVENADGTFTAERSDDITYVFNQQRMIQEFREPNGNKLLFEYDKKGRLIKVMHNLYLEENADGHPIFCENEQQFIAFEYGETSNNQDKIIKAINHFGINEDGTANEQVYEYSYYNNINSPHHGKLTGVTTNYTRPILYFSYPDNVPLPLEYDSNSVFEDYNYDNEVFALNMIEVPSNDPEYPFRWSTAEISYTDGTKKLDVLTFEDESLMMGYYEAESGYGESIKKTVATTLINSDLYGIPVSRCTFYTDSANHGVVIESRVDGSRPIYYENYTSTLQPQTVRAYNDAAHSTPVTNTYTYDNRGNVLSSTDALGIRSEYTYQSGTSWLTEQKVFDGETLLNRAQYTYDDWGNLLTSKIAVSNPATFTDIKTTTNVYDSRGLLLETTAWNGKKTVYTYDKFGRMASSSEVGDGKTLLTSYTYDVRNNLTSNSLQRGSNSITNEYQYDNLGYLVYTGYATGQKEYQQYTRSGYLVNSTTLGYAGQQYMGKMVTSYAYDRTGRLTETYLPRGIYVLDSFQAEQNEITTISTVGGWIGGVTAERETVSGSKNPVGVVDSTQMYQFQRNGTMGKKTYFDYAGNAVKTVNTYEEDGVWKEERPVHVEYDLVGRAIRQYDENLLVESYTDYDVMGNVFRSWTYVETVDGVRKYAVKEYSYDLLGRVTEVKEYLSLQARGSAPSGESQSTSYVYDTYDAVEGMYYDTVTDAEGGMTRTYYNQLGQSKREIQYGKTVDAAMDKRIITEWVYDEYARLSQVKAGASGDSLVVRQSYEYDAYDRVVRETTDSGRYTTYEYDHFGRRKKMTDRVDGEDIVTTWVYDENSNVIQMIQDGKPVNYSYNGVGELVAMQYGNTGSVRTIAYGYDSLGRPVEVRSAMAGAGTVEPENLKTVKSYHYGANGDLNEAVEYLDFDRKANLQGTTVVEKYSYDSLGRVTELEYVKRAGEAETLLEKYTQSYDGRSYATGGSYNTNSMENRYLNVNRTYEYDAIGRLISVDVSEAAYIGTTSQINDRSYSYGYDKVGNRQYQSITEDGNTETDRYSYNNLYQLIKSEKGNGSNTGASVWQVEREYQYDAYGNRTLETQYHVDYAQGGSQKIGDIRYTYNNASQLVKVEEKLESASDYTVKSRNVYNGEGQRIRQYNEAGEYERYFYMGGALAFTTGSSTDYVPSENILGPDGRIIASKRGFKEIYENPTESAYQFYHYDMQASVGSIVLGEEGAAGYRYTERNQYDPFGKQNESTSFSEVENNIKYGGGMSDSSGLYYMGARHYDPNVGRFLQQDSYKGDRYSPWTQNLYTYTSNNPINYIDPTGHSFELLDKVFEKIRSEVEKRQQLAKKQRELSPLKNPVFDKLDKAVDSLIQYGVPTSPTGMDRYVADAIAGPAIQQTKSSRLEQWGFIAEVEQSGRLRTYAKSQEYSGDSFEAQSDIIDQRRDDYEEDLNRNGYKVVGMAFYHTHISDEIGGICAICGQPIYPSKKDAGFYYDHRKTYSTQYVIIPNGGRVLVQRVDMSTYAGGKATYKESTDPDYQINEDIYLGEFGHHVQTIMK